MTQNAALSSLNRLPEEVCAAVRNTLAGTPEPVSPWGWSIQKDFTGGVIVYEEAPTPRRWGWFDKGGNPQALLEWKVGGLSRAHLALPDGGVISIHPGEGDHPLWGPSDQIRWKTARGETGEGLFAALDYHHLDHIPPFDTPASLPPGGGAAILNLLASLMADQGRESAVYRGHYPTRHLFYSLERSFRLDLHPRGLGEISEAELERVFSGKSYQIDLPLHPHPWHPRWLAEGVLGCFREGLETLWMGNTPFRTFRSDGPILSGERIWRAEPDSRRQVGLISMGQVFQVLMEIDQNGDLITGPPPLIPADQIPPGDPLGELWRTALFSWNAIDCAPPLAISMLELAPLLSIRWAPLTHQLVAPVRDGLLIHAGLPAFYRELAARTPDGNPALMLLSDILSGCAPFLKRLAQNHLAEKPLPPSPEDLLERGEAARQQARKTLGQTMPELTRALMAGEELP